jgi:hypothetical protein
MPSGPSALAVPPFLDHLASDSARFRAVLADAQPGLRVPTCPDWDADDSSGTLPRCSGSGVRSPRAG